MPDTVLTTEQIEELLSATDSEVYSLLGAAAIATESSLDLLQIGRSGELYQSAPRVLGSDIPFEHQGFERIAKTFLRNWATQLRKAICENDILAKEEKARGRREVDLIMATVIASITASIPQLAGFSVLLNILAVMVSLWCKRILSGLIPPT